MRILEVKKILVGIFMVGFLVGIIYANLFMRKYISSVGIFSNYFLEQYSISDIKTNEYLGYLVKTRLLPVLLLGIMGCTKFKKITGTICVLWTGYSSGLILTTAVMKMGIKGILLCMIGMTPHFICYIAAYIMIVMYLFAYPEVRWNSTKTFSMIIFVMLGIVSECYVNPVLMGMFIKAL